MTCEIGSEFWFSKSPGEMGDKLVPSWITKHGETRLTSSGRGAISLMLQEINPDNKVALLPAYLCETMVIPFIADGYECCFYDIDKELKPILDSIDLSSDTGVLLHLGYFGFPGNQKINDGIKNMLAAVVLEDLTHTLFSTFQSSNRNDYVVASLRKWMGLPGGGFLASCNNNIKTILTEMSPVAAVREEALKIKAHYMRTGDISLKQQYLDLFARGEEMLDEDAVSYIMDSLSERLICELDVNELIANRRSNYRYLLTAMAGIDYLEPVYKDLPHNVCPLFFPVYIPQRREEIRQALIAEDIYCPVHWPVPPQVDLAQYPNAKYIYENILSLPCDQRYGLKDMERIVQALKRQG